MAEEIVKGKIGNALTSTAADHVVAVTEDIYDEDIQKYQSEINKSALITDEEGEVVENPLRIITTEGYLCSIVDVKGNKLLSITKEGQVELNNELLSETGYSIKVSEADNIYSVIDTDGYELLSINGEGAVRFSNELLADTGYSLKVEDTNTGSLFAIVDNDDKALFRIKSDGVAVAQNGIVVDGQKSGVSVVETTGYVFAILDAKGKVLFGIRKDGTTYVAKGIIEVLTIDEYENLVVHDDNIVYLVEDNGLIVAAYKGSTLIDLSETYEFFVEENTLLYRGTLYACPVIYINYEDMTVEVEYPDGYTGPILLVEDNLLYVVSRDAGVALTNAQEYTDEKIEETLATVNASIDEVSAAVDAEVKARKNAISSLKLKWDSTAQTVTLYGEDNVRISVMNAADFVVDGMLEDASFDQATNILTLAVNRGSDTRYINVDFSSLANVTAGNGLGLSNGAFYVKVDAASESYLTVSAAGVRLSGITDAIKEVSDGLADEALVRETADKELDGRISVIEASSDLGGNSIMTSADIEDLYGSIYS